MMEFLDKILWNNPVKSYFLAAGLAVAGLISAWIVVKLLRSYVITGAAETENRLDDLVAEVGVRPVSLLIFLGGLHLGTATLLMPLWLRNMLWSGFIVAWTVVGTVFAVRLLNGVLTHYVQRYADSSEKALYQQLVQTVQASVRVVVWIVAALFMVSNLGFNVSSLLAGLGLGGLALALAAKDTLSNIFGSFTILVNGPYRVGEAVRYQGQLGTVEAIGLRDTKIRTFDGHLIVVPNSLAPTSVVENISRRPSFRSLFTLGLTYDTPTEKLEEAKEIIRGAVTSQEGTTEDVRVHFLEFAESSINLQVVYFITDFGRLLDIRHAINSSIKSEFEKAGIRFAFKTITVEQKK
ncbi:MAG: mechanosensitive ion channel family protein [bacterium]